MTVPSRSVRYAIAPTSDNRAIVADDGWPYVFPSPAEATAISGSVARRNGSVVAVRLP